MIFLLIHTPKMHSFNVLCMRFRDLNITRKRRVTLMDVVTREESGE